MPSRVGIACIDCCDPIVPVFLPPAPLCAVLRLRACCVSHDGSTLTAGLLSHSHCASCPSYRPHRLHRCALPSLIAARAPLIPPLSCPRFRVRWPRWHRPAPLQLEPAMRPRPPQPRRHRRQRAWREQERQVQSGRGPRSPRREASHTESACSTTSTEDTTHSSQQQHTHTRRTEGGHSSDGGLNWSVTRPLRLTVLALLTRLLCACCCCLLCPPEFPPLRKSSVAKRPCSIVTSPTPRCPVRTPATV